MQPETRYARLGRDRIAYQVLGEGPPDLVLTSGSLAPVDMAWEDPGIALFFRTLASFSRLILFDRRGTGASDPIPIDSLPPWESYAQDLAAVLDEVGAEQAALLTQVDAGPMAMFFAGAKPERTRALLLANATARYLADDDYPIGVPAEVAEAVLAQVDQLWGTEAMVTMQAPSRAGDARFRRWLARFQRTNASPRAVLAFLRASFEMDASSILPLIQAPTLILHRRDCQLVPVTHGRYLAERIPGVHRHRRLHPAGRRAGRPALARAAERARRPEPPAGRGVRRPAGQDHRGWDAGHLRGPRTSDPRCGGAPGGTGRHRHPAGSISSSPCRWAGSSGRSPSSRSCPTAPQTGTGQQPPAGCCGRPYRCSACTKSV